MHRVMRNPFRLKVRRYAAHMVDINEYFNFFVVVKASDKIDDMELN